jgi:hypothetical protein
MAEKRCRLPVNGIEACECLRAWYGRPQMESSGDGDDSENDNDDIDSQ